MSKGRFIICCGFMIAAIFGMFCKISYEMGKASRVPIRIPWKCDYRLAIQRFAVAQGVDEDQAVELARRAVAGELSISEPRFAACRSNEDCLWQEALIRGFELKGRAYAVMYAKEIVDEKFH